MKKGKPISRIQDVSTQIEFLKMKENDSRRDKRRCEYYLSEENYCCRYNTRCIGSSHCAEYLEPSSSGANVFKTDTISGKSAKVRANGHRKRSNAPDIIQKLESSSPASIKISSGSIPKLKNGTVVVHPQYGEGPIKLDPSGVNITVTFADGKKKFQYPEAFKMGYLKVKE